MPFMNTGIPGPIKAHLSLISSSKQLSSPHFCIHSWHWRVTCTKLMAINASNLGECKWGTTFPHVGRTPGWRGHISSLSCFHFSTSILQIELLLHFLLYMFIPCLWPSRTRSRVPACFTSPPGVISAVSDFCPFLPPGKVAAGTNFPPGRKRRLTHDSSSRSWLSSKRLSRPKTKN